MKPCSLPLLRSLLGALLLAAGLNAQAQQPPRLELCASCHGPQGNSQIPQFPSLAGQPRIFMENQLVLIREGLRDIPPMKGVLDGLDDAALIELAKYYAAQAPAPMPGAVDAARYQRGKDLAATSLCGSCHLPDYKGRDQIPRLAGQHEAFLREVMLEYRDKPGPGRDTVMTNALRGFSNAQLDEMAHFLAHFGKQP
ncbi:MAG: cytochrome c4 [Hylemonella sp.]|uniref:c-type cytochrome n=1 Tax=Hylemonella sp. TaxID=2066020 RepID=UPI0022CBA938|nr:c-type cytochrome [Hylemonella sp.]MCZ8253214.1 cytochrome c4 [Hylemonella sp.]